MFFVIVLLLLDVFYQTKNSLRNVMHPHAQVTIPALLVSKNNIVYLGDQKQART